MPGHQNIVISGYHIAKLVKYDSEKMRISLDLGLTISEVIKSKNEIIFPDNQKIKLSLLKKINKKRQFKNCFLIKNNSLLYLYLFDGNMICKLYEPHINWPPTLWINGSMMHTVSVSKPIKEAEIKVKTLGRIQGNVLDTCFGLGYISIELIKKGAKSVRTCEFLENVIEIARVNPWSREVFSNKKIMLENSDICKAIKHMKDKEFDLIIHDPPNVKINGDLYSLSFYKELYRVLKNRGKLYHFVGGGRIPREYKINYLKGVVNRLSEAGFKNVQKSYRGVSATKF